MRLDRYKDFLESHNRQDWSKFGRQAKSRYHTMRCAFEMFLLARGKTVLELGTSRSFVHGGLEGCNTSDTAFWDPNDPSKWDWGAGCFTRMAAETLGSEGATIYTVDIVPEHIARCKVMTEEFGETVQHHIGDSVGFVKNFPGGVDLLYQDTGDMTPIEPTSRHQLEEAKAIVEGGIVPVGGLLLIDDVMNSTPFKFGETDPRGKAKYSLPYLLDHGFEVIMHEYQVLLQRKT